MKIKEFSTAITESIKDRFHKDSNDYKEFFELVGDELPQKKLIRIQRIVNEGEEKLSTWKTILIVELENREKLKYALRWAALVKDSLLDPETADLYLFIFFEKDDISLEHSLWIELTEQFCRKYVQRPDETAEQLIDRSFLRKIEGSSKKTIDIDPLNNALSLTSSGFAWFTKEEQKKWKNVFLSAYIGSDLLEKLITENEE